MKVISLKNLQWEKTSHKTSNVLKKVISKNGELGNITQFGKAAFKSGDSVEKHSHETMYEVFFITSGKVLFVVEGKKIVAKKDDTIIIEPKEVHEQSNPYNKKVEWLYFGLATGEKV